MMELRKATPLLRGEVQGSSRDPLSHLRGAVERFGRKLRPLSLDRSLLGDLQGFPGQGGCAFV